MASEPTIRELDADECSCPNQHPHLDEFVAQNVNIHFEQMHHSQFWIGVTDPARGRMWHINCGSVSGRARGYSHCEEDAQAAVTATSGSPLMANDRRAKWHRLFKRLSDWSWMFDSRPQHKNWGSR